MPRKSTPPQAVREAAALVAEAPLPESIRRAAEAVAEAALGRAPSSPGRAVTQYIRHHFGEVDKDLREQVRRAALSALDREAPDRRVSPANSANVEPAYYTLPQAAERLMLTVRELKRYLVYPQARRTLGWPRCLDGVNWLLPRAAVDEPTSTIDVPLVEPPHNLPAYCLRADQVDMSVWPAELGGPTPRGA